MPYTSARVPILIGVLLVVIAALSFVKIRTSSSDAATIARDAQSFQELSDRFVHVADEKGGVYAFDVLRKADLPPGTDIHLLGHAIGDELYKQKGLSGIADCTQEFRNACSHSIVIGALNEFGTGVDTLKKIDDSCKKAPGGPGAYTMCYHGLGHGVFAYFGYDLGKTVAFCKRMGTKEYNDQQYTECVSGAIMELIGGGGHDHDTWRAARETYFGSNDPLSPCSRPVIPDEAKPMCYLYLTPHLFEAAGADLADPSPETFPKAFSYCDRVSDTEARNACFGGFGKEFVVLAAGRDIRRIDQFDDRVYATAANWCDVPHDAKGKIECIRGAVSSVFWGGENDPAASFRFCNAAPESLLEGCNAALAENIHSYTSGDVRAAWCAKLPKTAQPLCM